MTKEINKKNIEKSLDEQTNEIVESLNKIHGEDKNFFKNKIYLISAAAVISLIVIISLFSYHNHVIRQKIRLCHSDLESNVISDATINACHTGVLEDDKDSIVGLAKFYYNKKDYEKAIPLIKKCASFANTECQLLLSYIYSTGITNHIEQDISLAVEWLENAATAGSSFASWRAYKTYSNPNNYYKIPTDESKADEYFRLSVELKYPEALYENGKNLETTNVEKAIENYNEALSLGFTSASSKLINLYMNEKRYDDAFSLLNNNQENNSQNSYYLGYLYENGFGVKQDISKATENYIKAADENNDLAIVRLLKIYYQQNDYEQFKYYLSKALNNNLSQAYYYEALAYENKIIPFDASQFKVVSYNVGKQKKDIPTIVIATINSLKKGIEKNDINSIKHIYEVLLPYKDSSYSKDIYLSAVKLLDFDEELGNYRIAYCLGNGIGIDTDYSQSLDIYQDLIQNGHNDPLRCELGEQLAKHYYVGENSLLGQKQDASIGNAFAEELLQINAQCNIETYNKLWTYFLDNNKKVQKYIDTAKNLATIITKYPNLLEENNDLKFNLIRSKLEISPNSKEFAELKENLIALADNNYPAAIMYLTNTATKGLPPYKKENKEEAMIYLNKTCDMQYGEACYQLAVKLQQQEKANDIDYKLVYDYLKKAIDYKFFPASLSIIKLTQNKIAEPIISKNASEEDLYFYLLLAQDNNLPMEKYYSLEDRLKEKLTEDQQLQVEEMFQQTIKDIE